MKGTAVGDSYGDASPEEAKARHDAWAEIHETDLRVTRRGGLLVFTLRDDAEQLPEYPAHCDRLYAQGCLCEIFRTEAFASLPCGEPDVRHRVHVCEASE